MALYHKYRPKTFEEVVGQEHVTTTISNQIKNNKISHAYLFSGPRGVGKTTIARILAKSLNCEKIKDNESVPCNSCQTCEEIDKSNSIDVIEMDAATHTQVDNIRENVIENVQFRPSRSKYKIFIIDEVHMLSTGSFNALLKTLEEPPKYVIFILATTELNKIPETIISRCQRYNFVKVNNEEMKKYLKEILKKEKTEAEDEVLDRVVRKSEGCVRDALSLLDQLLAINNKKIKMSDVELLLPSANLETQMDFLEYLLKKDIIQALSLIEKMAEDGQNISFFSKSFIEFLHFFLLARADFNLAKKQMNLEKNTEKKSLELLKLINNQELVKLIDLCLKRDAEIKTSPLPQIPLELLILEWSQIDNQNEINPKNNTENTFLNTEIKKPDITTKTVLKSKNKAETESLNSVNQTDQKETEKICEKVKSFIIGKNRDINFEEMKAKWPECLKKIEIESPSLIFILKMADLIKIEDNILTVEVSYEFHREKLTEAGIKSKIENIFYQIFAEKIKLDVNLNSEKKQDIVEPQSDIQNLASALGGEII
ncbi:MAG: DNA polymerase III subunit gamma/tau [Patescibacteria group bacterium]